MLSGLEVNKNTTRFKTDRLVLIAKIKNESKRIPFFLSYYRMLGVESFIFIDNNSTDGTLELIRNHDDILVFSTNEPLYSHSEWIKEVLENYRLNHWSLVVDIDELLCFPYLEDMKLTQLIEYLDSGNYNAVEALLLDTYPRDSLVLTDIPNYCSSLSEINYFDSGSHFLKKTRYYAGVRKRVFDAEPCLTKFPLFKYDNSITIEAGMHSMKGASLPGFSTALLHHKFDSSFEAKTQEAIKLGTYWNNSEEYRKYACKNNPILYDKNFSTQYLDSRTLIDKGIMRVDVNLSEYTKKIKNPTVSIIVCSKGIDAIPTRLLESIREQTYKDFELIVIDNNFTPTIGSDDSIITKIIHEKRAGLSFARNKGIEASLGNYVLFIDDDVILDENCVAHLINGTERFQSDMVGGSVLLRQDINPNLTKKERRFLSELTYLEEIEKVRPPKYIVGACMLVRRSAFIKYGFFFTGLGRKKETLLSGEETEFIKRVNKYGGKVSYMKDATCIHNINLERTKFGYLLRRAYWQGITDCKIDKLYNEEVHRSRVMVLNIKDTLLNLMRRIGYQVEAHKTRN